MPDCHDSESRATKRVVIVNVGLSRLGESCDDVRSRVLATDYSSGRVDDAHGNLRSLAAIDVRCDRTADLAFVFGQGLIQSE